MSAVLDIDRWNTRIRRVEPALAQSLAAHMRPLVERPLADALAAATRRALAQAALPADAAVALRRLELSLTLTGAVDARQLSAAWAAIFADALAARLARTPAGDAGDDAQEIVWFADHWAAEYRHLERLANGDGAAWWARALAAADGAADELTAPAILHRWLLADGARALASLARLATNAPGVVGLLDSRRAGELTARLLARLTMTDAAGPPSTAAAAGEEARNEEAIDEDEATINEATINEAAADENARRDDRLFAAALAALLSRHATLRHLLSAGGSWQTAAPWLLAALLSDAPALSRLPATTLARGVQSVLQAGTDGHASPLSALPSRLRRQPLAAAARRQAPSPPLRPPFAGQDAAGASAAAVGAALDAVTADAADVFVTRTVFAGGLLLLLRPLQRGASLPDAAALPQALADLALLALRRVLAPLPRGERAVAEERERPLLTVFAPHGDWCERVASRPIERPAAAENLLDELLRQIPADLAAVPAAERQVFGASPPRYASEGERRLARLLLRPGELRVSRWQAELFWPLSAVDPALRRSGIDQDPGWLPWLGRKIVFHFGLAP